jgi:hypothetical protein
MKAKVGGTSVRRDLAIAVGLLVGGAHVGCSNASPSASPNCDVQGGLHAQGGACVAQELPPAQNSTVPSNAIGFSRDVQPIFTHYCGVVGCHVSGSPTGGLNLAPGFAYGQLVGVAATGIAKLPSDGMSILRVVPNDLDHSYLHIKISGDALKALQMSVTPDLVGRLGTLMPAEQTGSTLDSDQIGVIDNWILAGAVGDP